MYENYLKKVKNNHNYDCNFIKIYCRQQPGVQMPPQGVRPRRNNDRSNGGGGGGNSGGDDSNRNNRRYRPY